jgi:hypothetical protein
MRIEKVNLITIEIQEVDGEFVTQVTAEKTVPCMITNFALKRGKDLGLLKTSLISSLVKLQGLEKAKGGEAAVLDALDETEIQTVIYIGILGANKKIELTFEDFLDQYHYSFDETVELYTSLLKHYMPNDNNAFAKGLAKSTKAQKKGNK